MSVSVSVSRNTDVTVLKLMRKTSLAEGALCFSNLRPAQGVSQISVRKGVISTARWCIAINSTFPPLHSFARAALYGPAERDHNRRFRAIMRTVRLSESPKLAPFIAWARL
jgi:hypothetical protein